MNGRAALLLAAFVIAGCGAGAHPHHAPLTTPSVAIPNQPLQIPSPAPTGIPAPRMDVAVIRGWANALRHGHVAAAARYFALPSEMINEAAGGSALVLKIRTVPEALAAQKTLPCGARLLSTDLRGRYVNALFALAGRPGPGGSSCGGTTGTTARTNFVIVDGRILQWIRAPSEPGDRGASPGPANPPGSSANA
jgi:hypothetical protein